MSSGSPPDRRTSAPPPASDQRTTDPKPVSVAHQRRSRTLRRLGLLAVGVVVALGLLGLLGPRFRTITASSAGMSVELTYASVIRPGLAATWVVEVRSPGGFAGPITIATTATYFDGFDFNALYPDPVGSVSRGDRVSFTFEPPRGEVFRVRFDGRATPTWTLLRSATTVVSGEGLPKISLEYRTVFLP